jgi:hypothetical protein
MPEFLAWSFADRAPGMWVPVSVESEDAIAFANLKTELAVEIFRCGEIGDDPMNPFMAVIVSSRELPEFNPAEKIFAT